MSQSPSSVNAIPSASKFDIGPGGLITDDPANHALVELIEKARPLSPAELHALAVSYQSDSKLGHYLAFIALNRIFQSPQMRQYQAAILQQANFQIDPCPVCCAIFGGHCQNCHCLPAPEPVTPGAPVIQVKRVSAAGLDLLVEVTQMDENKTLTVLGVGPSVLTIPS
jgi:hypothetical protein